MLVVDASVQVEALLQDGAARNTLCKLWPPASDWASVASNRHLWPRAWELRCNLSPSDAIYVALAKQLGATLLTADARAARAP
jgi:predicted nucleic acid-binding protein